MSTIRTIGRSLLRAPGFTATAVLTLAIGIAASTAMFSVVHAVLLKPLPYHEPGRLVELFETNPPEGYERAGVSTHSFSDWRDRAKTLDDMALMLVEGTPWVIQTGGAAEQAFPALVTTNLFTLMGVRPVLGREFSQPGPAGSGHEDEVVLSYGLWQRMFGGDPSVIGRQLRLEGRAGHVIVGVMPPAFAVPAEAELWLPLDLRQMTVGGRDMRVARVVGRLTRGASVNAARAELAAIAASLAGQYPATNTGWSVRIEPLHQSSVGDRRVALLSLFGATAMVMLVGCANVSNLLLARGITRRTEIAVRAALGATRTRLMRLLLAEAFLLSAAGAAIALLLVQALLPLIVRYGSATIPRMADARVNVVVLVYCMGAAVVTATVAGLLPAFRTSRLNARAVMTGRTQALITAGQLAACVVLVSGAVLFVRTLVHLRSVDIGFTPAQVVAIQARIPMHRSTNLDRWQTLSRDVMAALDRVRAMPGVEAAAAINHAPLSGTMVPVKVEVTGRASDVRASYRNVTPGFFSTLGIGVIAGRDFTNADMSDLARLPDPRQIQPREGAVIVNETAARQWWPNEDAIGKTLSTEYDSRAVSRRRVVGVVRDVRSAELRDAAPAEIYVPYLEDPSFAFTMLVRTPVAAGALAPAIRNELRQITPDLSTANIRPYDEIVSRSFGSAPYSAAVVAAFAVIAMLLAGIGIFGVFAFSVAARAREVGIRVAIGATRRDVIRLFWSHAAAPIAGGVVLGVAVAVALAQLVASLLYGVPPTDPVSFGVAALAMTVIALAASYLPVRRVLAANPWTSLREL